MFRHYRQWLLSSLLHAVCNGSEGIHSEGEDQGLKGEVLEALDDLGVQLFCHLHRECSQTYVRTYVCTYVRTLQLCVYMCLGLLGEAPGEKLASVNVRFH